MQLPTTRTTTFLVKLILDKGFIAFCLIFIAYLLYLITTPYNYLPFDSGIYWGLGNQFIKDGTFSLLNYNNIYRGYFYPLINLPFNMLWNATGIELFAIIKILGAFTAALFFGAAVPGMVRKACKIPEISVLKRLLFAFLGFVFWRDHFNFTLSDFPALLVLTFCAIILLSKPRLGWIIVAGMLFGAAVNIRPIYAICIPLIPTYFLANTALKYYADSLLKVSVFFIGFIILSVPQIVINMNLLDNNSPLVQAQHGLQKKNLYLRQLEWGLIVQKYETTIDPEFPHFQLIFIDPDGVKFVKENDVAVDMKLIKGSFKTIFGISDNPENSLQGFGKYFELVMAHPGFFIRSWLKHIFNGFDIQYPTPYIANVNQVHYGLIRECKLNCVKLGKM